ncbi:MAG: addiction module protein [Nitrospirae bacterium]|nr:addiction module protein [Nitrospirota bacterium]
MSNTIQLEKMSIEEKIRVMESIWDDLCNKAEGIVSPSWHKEVLEDREKGIVHGSENFSEWDSAKKIIRKEVS